MRSGRALELTFQRVLVTLLERVLVTLLESVLVTLLESVLVTLLVRRFGRGGGQVGTPRCLGTAFPASLSTRPGSTTGHSTISNPRKDAGHGSFLSEKVGERAIKLNL